MTCRNCIHNKVCRRFEELNAIEPERAKDKIIYRIIFRKDIDKICKDFCKEFPVEKAKPTVKATVDTDRGFAYCGRCDNILASVYTFDREKEMVCKKCGTVNKERTMEL